MADLSLARVTKAFGDTVAVDDVSIDIPGGDFLALLGPSGCGKTTILRMIAGFEAPTSGKITHGGTAWADTASGLYVAAEKRRVGVVFQSYALWPHLDVAGNVGYPLRVAKVSRAERERAVGEALEIVGLSGLGDRRPAALSGGQRQRVALARCLVMKPEIVVLDEPLANLDVHLRATMMDAFATFHRESGATMIYITHDQAEAMALADRIAVMFDGRIAQIDTPERIFDRPVNEMVARFIGDGDVVTIPAERRNGSDSIADFFGQAVTVPAATVKEGGQVAVCVRPHRCRLDPDGPVHATVMGTTYCGSHWMVDVAPAGQEQAAFQVQCATRPPGRGHAVRIRVDAVTPVGATA